MLAHAGLITEMTGFAPVLLLDEVVAHLDPARRAALYDALATLGAQVWMTGADPAAFADIVGRAQVFDGAAPAAWQPAQRRYEMSTERSTHACPPKPRNGVMQRMRIAEHADHLSALGAKSTTTRALSRPQ